MGKELRKEIRIVGIDDASFDKFKDKETLVIATFFRGGNFVDGIMSAKVKVDGSDSTDKIIQMINKSKFKSQIKCIMLDGIAVGGFNVIDIVRLNKETNIPVMIVIRKMPDFKKIKSALKKLGMQEKIRLIENAGEVIKINNIFTQFIGIDKATAKKFLDISCTHSFIPEPIRVAHLIGQGIGLGESKGDA